MSAVAGGLFSPIGLVLLLPALMVRGDWWRVRWRLENTLLLFAAVWACLVIAIRGSDGMAGSLPYFLFLWTLPHILASYKPDQKTVRKFESLLLILFVIDVIFNVGTLITGADLLGRDLDRRDGVLAGLGRLGGIFGHSFYSGAISLAALLTLVARHRLSWIVVLPAVNLIIAGSWRFTLVLFIVAILAIRWRQRSRFAEIATVIVISLAIVTGVLMTSGLFNSEWVTNTSNAFRVFAWFNALEKIAQSPWIGVGYPNEKAIGEVGVSFDSLDEYLIAESWYLGSAITFGVPYTLLFLGAFLAAFLGPNFTRRNLTQAILYPLILIDLTYGSFFGGLLIYFWLWLLIVSTPVSLEVLVPPRKIVCTKDHRKSGS